MMEQTLKKQEVKLVKGLSNAYGLNPLEKLNLYIVPQWLELIFSNFLRIYPIFSN